ncbi:MAG: hypothetical protein GXO64_03295 [Candidatus Micrarchaeota archaeon]|nr:hypothetical protein [Candidatus Micrarchaeota archaeon]
MKRIILTILAFTALLSLTTALSDAAGCSGFGTITHAEQTVTAKPGSYAYIDVSFFNCKKDDLTVELSIDNLPSGWWADIESPDKEGPNMVYLKSETPTRTPKGGGSWFILSDGATYIRTVPVRFKIGIPSDTWGGLYILKATAFASPAHRRGGGGFSIIPKFGREFIIRIQVPAPYKPQNSKTDAAKINQEISETKIIEDLSNKIETKKKATQPKEKKENNSQISANENDNVEEPSIIQGSEKNEPVSSGNDGLTGFMTGGIINTNIIILAIIIIVMIALLFYLRS